MIVRFLLAALAAGLIAGLAMTPAQYGKTIPLIMQAEAYENGEAGHDHHAPDSSGATTADDGHAHSHGDGESVLGFGRFGNTVLANIVAGCGFALMLAAVALLTGIEFPVGREGLIRGLVLGAGAWFSVQLAPSFGLPPAVPGFPYADLGDRQTWWMLTVAASAAGLWLLALRPEWIVKAVGLAIIAAPHLWGAPVPEDIVSNVPAYIASAYAAASLATTLFFWLLLGGALGVFMARAAGSRPA
ncbi:CbtA family protein [uncultured Hoeflea sp.]|uniref:CbtA family protein n=1 Tax=uncultured Hoeflea sp. TaxID=538666 RepID=UPI0026385742|nr:CbtA family protein [uncultured Hoeflea sp.]